MFHDRGSFLALLTTYLQLDLVTVCSYRIRHTHNASIVNESMQCSFFISNLFGGSDDTGKVGQVEVEKVNVSRRMLFLYFCNGSNGLVFAARTHKNFGPASCQANNGFLATEFCLELFASFWKMSRLVVEVDVPAGVASGNEIHPP